MNEVRKLHEEAMAKYDTVVIARREQKPVDIAVLREAYDLERQAAEMLRDNLDAEPSRSILFEGAATMATELGLLEEAKSLRAEVTRFEDEEIEEEMMIDFFEWCFEEDEEEGE